MLYFLFDSLGPMDDSRPTKTWMGRSPQRERDFLDHTTIQQNQNVTDIDLMNDLLVKCQLQKDGCAQNERFGFCSLVRCANCFPSSVVFAKINMRYINKNERTTVLNEFTKHRSESELTSQSTIL